MTTTSGNSRLLHQHEVKYLKWEVDRSIGGYEFRSYVDSTRSTVVEVETDLSRKPFLIEFDGMNYLPKSNKVIWET